MAYPPAHFPSHSLDMDDAGKFPGFVARSAATAMEVAVKLSLDPTPRIGSAAAREPWNVAGARVDDSAPVVRTGVGRRRAVLSLAAALGIALASSLATARAWRETELREAYLPQLQQQAAASPNDGPLLALLGARLAQSQEPEEKRRGTQILVRALAAGEQREDVWLSLAYVDAYMGDSARALATLKQAQQTLAGQCPAIDAAITRVEALPPGAARSQVANQIAPNGVDPLIRIYAAGSSLNGIARWWGRRHLEQSGYATREELARDEPSNAEAQRLWGLALLTNDRPSEAIKVLVHAVSLAPDSAATNIAYARALEARSWFSYACFAYLEALRRQPRNLEALLGFGRTSTRAGVGYGRTACLRATELFPASADAWIELARADRDHPDYAAEAVQSYEKAARLAPGRTDFRVEYAEARIAANQTPGVEPILRACIAQHPEDPEAHFALAQLLLRTNGKAITEAETETREALRLNPAAPQYLQQLGAVLLREGRPAQGIPALRSYLVERPDDTQTLRLLVQACLRQGDTAAASQLEQRARSQSTVRERISRLDMQASQRYADSAYHRELKALYTQDGQSARVESERVTLEMLQHNRTAFLRSHAEMQSDIAAALGPSAAP